MHEIIVIGSGPSAAAALLELKSRDVLVLDVGNRSPLKKEVRRNLFDIRENDDDQDRMLIGEGFESLKNVVSEDVITVKLKAPYVSFVLKDLQRFFPVRSEDFTPFLSYAFGGLANAWGGGAYPFTDYELSGFPIDYRDLEPFYSILDDHVGISGTHDDLYEYLGPCEKMLPPVQLGASGQNLMKAYRNHRLRLQRRDITLGRSRLCVLTERKNGRRACAYENLSFFTCNSSYFYNPAFTVKEVLRDSTIAYVPGIFVDSFRQERGVVTVTAREVDGGKRRAFRCRRLVIATGTLGTGRMVLNSFGDFSTRLPLMENALSMIPFIDIRNLGAPLDRTGYEGGAINLLYDGPLWEEKVLGALSTYISPLRGDAFSYFPFAAKGTLALMKYMLPALSVMLMFYPSHPRDGNFVTLQPDGGLQIRYGDVDKLGRLEKKIIRSFFGLGFLSAPFLVQYPRPGNSIHYAGTVPMGRFELPYHVDRDCRLNRARNVILVDGSVFPVLPAKNLSYTIMANSMRAARAMKADLDSTPLVG
ncbi:MAG TPA: GMC family oxidoreductase [Candidatus Aminicenantes bacterium]|nr:GMC family oxidoreductase [Candidatus Aminicenantes bacterium]